MCQSVKRDQKNIQKAGVGENFIFFRFFEKFSKLKQTIIFSLKKNLNIKIHPFGWKSCQSVKCKKMSTGPVGENFIFFGFTKSFQKWKKPSYFHFRTTKISKFTHLGKKRCQSVKCAKHVHRAGVGIFFNFFDFLKSFQNWRIPSYFHFRKTKISKFSHLDEHGAKVWNAQKMSLGQEPEWWKLHFFRFFEKFSKLKETFILSL